MKSGQRDEDALIDEISLPRSASPHPKALLNFSVARFFERLSFFSMCQWLILFLIAKSSGPNDTATFYTTYQWVILAIVLAQVPGGLIIDLWYDKRKAVVWGGVMLALGYFLLALNHDAATVMAFLFCFAGMGLYSVGSTGALNDFYLGREQYLTAGVYFYTAAINAAAFVASVALGLAASHLSWQQGCMLAAILMMLGHVYLLAFAKTFQEPKLPAFTRSTSEQSHSEILRRAGQTWVVIALALTSFLLASFAFQAGHNAAQSADVWGTWSNLTGTLPLLLGTGMAFIACYFFTRKPTSSWRLLGYGLLITVVSGILLPPLLTFATGNVSHTALVASSSLLIIMIATAETLVIAPVHALVLGRGGRYTHTFLGILSVFAYLPYFMLFTAWVNMEGMGGTGLIILGIISMVLAAWWLIREGKKILW